MKSESFKPTPSIRYGWSAAPDPCASAGYNGGRIGKSCSTALRGNAACPGFVTMPSLDHFIIICYVRREAALINIKPSIASWRRGCRVHEGWNYLLRRFQVE